MESEIESPEFLVDSLVQDPVQVLSNEFASVRVRDGHSMGILHQWHGHHLVVFRQGNLKPRGILTLLLLFPSPFFFFKKAAGQNYLKSQGHVFLDVPLVGEEFLEPKSNLLMMIC